MNEPLPDLGFKQLFATTWVDYSGKEVKVARNIFWKSIQVATLDIRDFVSGGVKFFVENVEDFLIRSSVYWKNSPCDVDGWILDWRQVARGLVWHGVCRAMLEKWAVAARPGARKGAEAGSAATAVAAAAAEEAATAEGKVNANKNRTFIKQRSKAKAKARNSKKCDAKNWKNCILCPVPCQSPTGGQPTSGSPTRPWWWWGSVRMLWDALSH